MLFVEVGDAAEPLARGLRAEQVELAHRVRHQAFTAGLVDGALTFLDDDRLEAGPRSVDGGGQARRPAPRDHQVDHVEGVRDRSALSSTEIRVHNSSALRTVNTSAVTQAV